MLRWAISAVGSSSAVKHRHIGADSLKAFKFGFTVLQKAALKWFADDAMTAGAAIAFYTIFSLGPVMLVVLAIAGTVFGEQAAHGAIFNQIASLVGKGGATAVEETIRSASVSQGSWIASLVGPITFFVSATGVFTQIQTALNGILRATPTTFNVLTLVRIRLISFALILAAGFILVVSLVVNAGIIAFGEMVFGREQNWLLGFLQTPVSLLVISAMFALIYKTLPDEGMRWDEAIAGALAAGVLFSVGKSVIGLYLGSTSLISSYGAAGTFILILLWVYYSSLIFLYGAEVASVWRDKRAPSRRRRTSSATAKPSRETT
jgi:membrane protein